MEPEFITYQKFTEVEFANMLVQLLEENDIPFIMEEEGPVFDPTFSYREDINTYAVKIRSEDFELVNEILLQNEADAEPVDEGDYYLFDFTDEELKEVLEKADEWSPFDINLARKILADRGKPLSDSELHNLHNKRLEELKAPETSPKIWINIGYICAFMGGVLGLFIGWHLYTHKKTLPNGEKIYGYSKHDREHGKTIFYLALASTILWVGWRVIHSTGS